MATDGSSLPSGDPGGWLHAFVLGPRDEAVAAAQAIQPGAEVAELS